MSDELFSRSIAQLGFVDDEDGRDEPPTFPFPFDGINPAPEYTERRARCPLGKVRLASGHDARLIVKYQDAVLALADHRLSHDLTAPGSPRFTAGPSHYDEPSLLNMEGLEHRRIRKIIAPAFTPRRIQRWNPILDDIMTELLDTMTSQGSSADVVSALCQPYPTRVMCQVLGIPDSDSHRFAEWSNAFVSSVALTGEQRTQLILEFAEYIAALLTRRRAEPEDGLIDDLISARDVRDCLTDSELIGLIISLIAAGTDTTSSVLSRSLLTLLSDDRRPWTQLVAHPELVPNAVNELLRLLVMGPSAALRMATEDVELPSGRIEAGEAVVIATSSAMRDETIYRDPHKVDFERSAPPPLVFGKGAHACLGMNLARTELATALRELIHRFPNLALATPVPELKFTDGEVLHSLTALAVTW